MNLLDATIKDLEKLKCSIAGFSSYDLAKTWWS